ncbi:hypothetical protein R1sor_018890 [Riccia sorocarpa]|uniref:DUF7869 domain-containing protein n=1 Tax=Riccia sorocarpa TaxID=122646 RepID=A0ABD3IAZ1_9MARC
MDFSSIKLADNDLGLSPMRLLPTLSASLKKQKRFLASMSPPRELFSQFPTLVPLSNAGMAKQKQDAQDEDEDVGPFATENLSDSGEDKSAEEVPVTGRRFKETLREQKPPRLQPADGKYHLPNNFTKKEVYDHYMTDMAQVQECLQYSSKLLDEAVEALKLHRKQQAEERAAAGRRRWKALDSPKDCAYIQIDNMDQKKTALPHFARQSKSVDGAALVGVHLVGAMIFHGKLQTRVFLTYNNLKSDSNLTITVLQKVLLEWEGTLPPTLYLQLDNTVRENKNNILFAYLSMLLEKKVFTKIKLGFLLDGHTHDFVDQMFSCFSQALRRENAFTMSRLRSVIENSYDPKHVTTILTQT